MDIVVIDFETYYTTEYSLSKMTTAEYIRDSRFEAIGFSASLNGKKPLWFTGTHAEMDLALRALCDFEDTMVVAHNAMFDGGILEWVFGLRPKRYFCTMMGARPHVVPFMGRMSLDHVASFYDLGTKGETVKKVKDMHRVDFPGWLMMEYGAYCMQDVHLTSRALTKIWPTLPPDERDLLSLTIEKFTRPKLVLDTQVLDDRLEVVLNSKAAALLTLPNGLVKEDLTSNERFANALRSLGVDPPNKLSPTTGLTTYAFAKQDEGLLDLKDHPDPKVRCLIEARLLWKSSLEETRLKRLRGVANATGAKELAVPLLYYGAHTGRLSGTDSLNLQNLPRPKKGELGLRHALVAPPGHKVVTVDLSQIEARIVATLAGCSELIKQFRDNLDPYSAFATRAFGYPVAKATHPIERFVGKTCILGLGYGVGAEKLRGTINAQAAAQNINVEIDLLEAKKFVNVYREGFHQIPSLWRQLGNVVLAHMLAPNKAPLQWEMLEIHHQKLVLPNGMPIYYPNLSKDPITRDITYTRNTATGPMTGWLWGGSLLENIVQALARIIISRAELRLARAGLKAVLQVHDELVYVVKDEHVDRVKHALMHALTDPVPWMPRLPLGCEVGSGQSYGSAK